MATTHSHAPSIIALPPSADQPLSIRAKALVFYDPASRRLLDFMEQVGPSQAPVLITGETGTGKELVARHIHYLSGRQGAFVAVNCGAISEHIAESELFGHEVGAYSGAVGRRAGWFEEADGGTLFLDEIGDLPLALQVKLLRVLQEGEVVRLGSRKSTAIDVRLVTATNVDLQQAVNAGHFRLDLLYRINVAQMKLSPLRERPLDIMPLAEHFRGVYSQRMKIQQPMLSEAAMQALIEYPWPGNIRELENVMHLALLVASGGVIRPEHLKFSEGLQSSVRVQGGGEKLPQEEIRRQLQRLFQVPGESLLNDIEQLIVQEAFTHTRFHQVRTAALLGVTRNMVRTLLIRHGLLQERSSGDAG